MTENKETIRKYIAGFIVLNHEQILACLSDDVEWIIPGYIHTTGKEAFEKNIENKEFEGNPMITITRMVEEDNVVVFEGTVKHKRKDSGMLNAKFCDVAVMKDAKIRQLTSYLATI